VPSDAANAAPSQRDGHLAMIDAQARLASQNAMGYGRHALVRPPWTDKALSVGDCEPVAWRLKAPWAPLRRGRAHGARPKSVRRERQLA